MPSCYNSAFGQVGQRTTSPQHQQSNPNMASPPFGAGLGPSGFGHMAYMQGPSSNSTMGAFSSQFPRQPLPPPMFSNQSAMPDFGPNRFPPPFFGNFPPFGPSATASTSTASSSLAATPSPPPIMPSMNPFFLEQLANASGVNCFHGIGTIVWLTSDRGLIEKIADGEKAESGDRGPKSPNDDNNNRNNEAAGGSKSTSPHGSTNLQVAFGIKEFCDQNVQDLTSVLRVGYLVKFQAVMDFQSLAGNCASGKLQPPRLIATFICPLSLADWSSASPSVIAATKKLVNHLDTAIAEPLPCEDTNRRRTSYDLELELRAIQILMNIYREQPSAGPQCPLSTFHCIVSNCGDEQMYRYIGTSSQKRRQFVERRSHFFVMTPDDTVCLVPSAVYTVVAALSRELLQRGGAMNLQELFRQYLHWPDLPLEARELVGETKPSFMQFLQSHPFIFAIFPSKVFVSLHRRLPDFDYGAFLEEIFGDQEGSPYFAQCQAAMATSTCGNQGGLMGLGSNGGGVGHGQQPPPMQSNRWNMDERQGNFGSNGPSHAHGAAVNRHLVSPPVFPQPTPPAYQQSYQQSTVPRFAQPSSTNYNAFNVPPPLPAPGPCPRPNVAGYLMNQWPPPPHGPGPGPDGMVPPPVAMTNMGGSNHSLSSGYSTGPAPSTPGFGQGHGQQFWPAQAGGGRNTIPTPDNVAGFWKSYDLGTETLIRQLNSAAPNQQNRANQSRTTPTPPAMLYGPNIPPPEILAAATSRRASQMATPENIFLRPSSSASSSTSCRGMLTNDTLAQTERFLLALKCGHCGLDNEWLFPLLNHANTKGLLVKMKPATAEIGIQTDQIVDEDEEVAKTMANMRM